jgi:hypothetical protein
MNLNKQIYNAWTQTLGKRQSVRRYAACCHAKRPECRAMGDVGMECLPPLCFSVYLYTYIFTCMYIFTYTI